MKLVVPAVSGMPLMVSLNPLEQFALMSLPHGLRGPLDLLGKSNLLGEVFFHGSLLDEVAEEVSKVLDVLSSCGIGQVVTGNSLVEPVNNTAGSHPVDVLVTAHVVFE